MLPEESREVAGFLRAMRSYVSLETSAAEFLLVPGSYWSLCTLELHGQATQEDRDYALEQVRKSKNNIEENGHIMQAWGGGPGHDPHIHYTCSAVQVYILCGKLDEVDRDAVARYIRQQQLPDGSFRGDSSCEVDSRFTYCAFLTCYLLGLNPCEVFNVKNAVDWVLRCRNMDGGFGQCPGAESHAAQVWVSLCTLSLAARADASLCPYMAAELPFCTETLPEELKQTFGFILSRQLPSGALSGRPEKRPDACYGWWAGATAAILGAITYWDQEALVHFLTLCHTLAANPVGGHVGFADRPRNSTDIYHSFFASAGMALLRGTGLAPMDAVLALPLHILEQAGIQPICPVKYNS